MIDGERQQDEQRETEAGRAAPGAGGRCHAWRLMNTVLREQPPAYPWGDTLPLFHQADVRLCNLECALSDGGVPWSATPKVFHFRSDTKLSPPFT
ncbi:MAG TPA: CapA family protein [Ktedonobacteraceae bacterium]|nr:CapA family protein [Ktedonobacteraceae bacterium]